MQLDTRDVTFIDYMTEVPVKDGLVVGYDEFIFNNKPDNPAGVIYSSPKNWESGLNGWSALSANITASIENGKLRAHNNGVDALGASIKIASVYNGNYIRIEVTTQKPLEKVSYYNGTAYVDLTLNLITPYSGIAEGTITTTDTETKILVNRSSTDQIQIAFFNFIYVGDTTYLSYLRDISGNGNDATFRGISSSRKWFNFNGVDSHIKIPYYSGGSRFKDYMTISVWFYLNQWNTTGQMIFETSSNANAITGSLYYCVNLSTAGRVAVTFKTTSSWVTGAFSLPSTGWYHTFVEIDRTQASGSNFMKVYINNVQQSLTLSPNDTDRPLLSNLDTYLGLRVLTTLTSSMVGLVDIKCIIRYLLRKKKT